MKLFADLPVGCSMNLTTNTTTRGANDMIRVVSETLGLVRTVNDTPAAREYAESLCLMVAVNTGHTVYLIDGEEK